MNHFKESDERKRIINKLKKHGVFEKNADFGVWDSENMFTYECVDGDKMHELSLIQTQNTFEMKNEFLSYEKVSDLLDVNAIYFEYTTYRKSKFHEEWASNHDAITFRSPELN